MVRRFCVNTVTALIVILLLTSLGDRLFSTRASTTTLTGTIRDAQGNPINGVLVMQLPVPAQDATTNTAVAPIPVRFNIINGQITGGSALYDVAALQPANLYYTGTVYDSAGNYIMGGNYAVTGGIFNLGAATPTSITTSNISYAVPALVGADNTFTGNNIFDGSVTLNGTTIVGISGLTFDGNASDPAGAPGMLNWRTDLKLFRFFDTAWHSIPGLDVFNVWTNPQNFSAGLSTSFIALNGSQNLTVVSGNSNVVQTAAADVHGDGAGTPACFDGAGNTTGSGCTQQKGVQVYLNCPMSSNLTVTSSGTKEVVPCHVTMPSGGCPCRAQVNWSVTVDVTNNNHINFWVTDGSTSFRASPVFGQTSDETGSSGSVMTPSTYTNGAVINFALDTAGAGSPSYVVNAASSVAGGNSGMDVSVFTSN